MALLGTGSSRRRRSVMLDPTWPERATRGSRVVIESGDAALSEAASSTLRDAGYEVAACTGPDERHRCPLFETGHCALVEGGQVVINLLGCGDSDRGRVLPHLRSRYPDMPVVAELSASEREAHAAVMEGVCVADLPLRRDSLLAQVAAAESRTFVHGEIDAPLSGMTPPTSPTSPSEPDRHTRPRWRGVSHHIAFYVSILVAPALVLLAQTPLARAVATVYVLSLAALFGCSALLHRVDWSPATRPWMRRLDHSMIFVFIAGTYTPVVALSLSGERAVPLLAAVWIGAAAGVAVTLCWIGAPRWVTATCYLAVGWIAVLALPELWSSLGGARFALLATGGLLYTVGAIVYARRRPDPWPGVFGYHEVFHALVIAAVICHWLMIESLVRR
jgi:hemolysin III